MLGITNEKVLTVTEEYSAKAMGSGILDVFATPAMVALMEGTAAESVEKLLEEGSTTVGIMIHTEHLAATPIGMKVRCTSKVTAVEGRKLSFEIEAFDEAGLIGKATHDRFIVNAEKFQNKTNEKISK